MLRVCASMECLKKKAIISYHLPALMRCLLISEISVSSSSRVQSSRAREIRRFCLPAIILPATPCNHDTSLTPHTHRPKRLICL